MAELPRSPLARPIHEGKGECVLVLDKRATVGGNRVWIAGLSAFVLFEKLLPHGAHLRLRY